MSRPAASDRVRRLLSVIPWVASHDGGVSIDEVCARFEMTRAQLETDLGGLAMMVGAAPQTPDTLIEVWVDDDWVEVTYPRAFDRPLQLTPDQATQLVAAGVGLRAIPGADDQGPLHRALEKLAAALGVAPGDNIEVNVGPVAPTIFAALDEARTEHRRVEIDYFSYNRDERTTRRIDPYVISAERGVWYVRAYCHLSDGERVFRLDRIEVVRSTAESFAPPTDVDASVRFAASPTDPRVRLVLAPSAAWVIESYPSESATRLDDGRIDAVFAISQPSWLVRLLLRLGPDAEVVEAPEHLRTVTADAARRALSRYH